MPVMNYTTTIAAAKTVSEIQQLLAKHGATRIMTEYSDGSPSGVTFELGTPHGPRAFTLPVDVDSMRRAIIDEWSRGKLRGISQAKADDRAHAERVAWRVLKDWLAAQLTLVETRMAAVDQVMLPYLRVDTDHTLYEAYREREAVLAIEGR